MRNLVFVPVDCPQCGHVSVNRFRIAELTQLFAASAPIVLRCPIDRHAF